MTTTSKSSRQTTSPSRRDDKTRETKRKILQGALQCFTEHGVEGATIEMIRARTGVSVGSLYHHFGNKDAIAAAVFMAGMHDFGRRARRYLSEADGAEAGIKAVVYANVDWICDNPDWARYVFHHRASVSQAGQDNALGEASGSLLATMQDHFAAALSSGALRAWPSDLVSALVSGPTHYYARQWLAGRMTRPLSDYREALAEAAWAVMRGAQG